MSKHELNEGARFPSTLPNNSAERKTYPLYSVLFGMFPSALVAVAKHAYNGNARHNGPDAPVQDARDKSTDDADCIMRHLLEGDYEGVAWRALRLLQKTLEDEGAPVAPRATGLTEAVVAGPPEPEVTSSAEDEGNGIYWSYDKCTMVAYYVSPSGHTYLGWYRDSDDGGYVVPEHLGENARVPESCSRLTYKMQESLLRNPHGRVQYDSLAAWLKVLSSQEAPKDEDQQSSGIYMADSSSTPQAYYVSPEGDIYRAVSYNVGKGEQWSKIRVACIPLSMVRLTLEQQARLLYKPKDRERLWALLDWLEDMDRDFREVEEETVDL